MQTPWGQSDGKEILAEGIVSYTTPSHGGIRLSPERQAELGYSANFLKSAEWWEEDCDWAVPYLFFSGAIRAYDKAYHFEENLALALEIVKRYHPNFNWSTRRTVCVGF